MANASRSTCPLDKLKSILDPSYSVGALSCSEYITTLSSQSTTSSTAIFSASMSNEKTNVSGEGTSVEDEIERSKVHWSQLVEHLDSDDDEVAEESNVEFFKCLQEHPTCGRFFRTFGDGGIFDIGKLEVGEKFAEGGQAELYHARVTWEAQNSNFIAQKRGLKFVLKVFKRGTFLRNLQKQWPQGMFQHYEKRMELVRSRKAQPMKHFCNIICGTLLQDGRFAFLMVKEREDLRTLIDRNMKERTSLDGGPFPMKMAFEMMYFVARGMDWLHNLNIVHRDLKASNVLCAKVHDNNGNVWCKYYVADFECSIGVVGTGFFRAPEILQALKDKVVYTRPNIFTKAGDVYGYGMICYEILTGKLPFEGHSLSNYDLVLQGQRPEVPHHVDEWVCDLLHKCWQLDASARPTSREILEVLKTNSEDCKEVIRLIENLEALSWEEQIAYKYEY